MNKKFFIVLRVLRRSLFFFMFSEVKLRCQMPGTRKTTKKSLSSVFICVLFSGCEWGVLVPLWQKKTERQGFEPWFRD